MVCVYKSLKTAIHKQPSGQGPLFHRYLQLPCRYPSETIIIFIRPYCAYNHAVPKAKFHAAPLELLVPIVSWHHGTSTSGMWPGQTGPRLILILVRLQPVYCTSEITHADQMPSLMVIPRTMHLGPTILGYVHLYYTYCAHAGPSSNDRFVH
jgi:hypothetical protein